MNSIGQRSCALVTGAAGFIGAHVCQALSRMDGMTVVGLDDLSGGFRDNVPEGVEFVDGSITDHVRLARLFEEFRFDYVYHLAAYAAEGLSHFIRRYNYTNNVVGSVNLVNESIRHRVKSFVFTSSIAVYGRIDPPMSEEQTPLPEDPYGVAKLAVEQDLRAARDMFGLNHVVFRPHNVYGELQNLGDPYRNVVGIFMNQILRDRPMTIFGDGEQKRAFSYVGDVAPLIAKSVFVPEAQNEVFNVGADSVCTVSELARAVARAMGRPEHPIEHLDERNEVKFAYADHTKVARTFGMTSQTPLNQGLEQMAAWAKRVGARAGKPFGEIEVTEGLPRRWRDLFEEKPAEARALPADSVRCAPEGEGEGRS